MNPEAIPLSEIPPATGQSKSVVYDAINAGHLKTFVVGRRRFARPAAVRKWVDYLEKQSDAGTPVIYRGRTAEPPVLLDLRRATKPATPKAKSIRPRSGERAAT